MRIETFRMERMQCLYENEVEYNLSESGVRPMRVEELLEGLDPAGFLSTALGYPHSNGSPLLRERIADLYPAAAPENVTVTNGGSEANLIALWTLLEPGDRLAVMIPNYMQSWGLGRHFAAGSDPFHLRLRGRGGGARWALDVEELDRVVTGRTRAILVTNPNNPTGSVLDPAEMDAVVEVARRSRAWLVADEIYRGAEVEGDLTPTFWGRYDKLIVTSGLSKAFALPGLRVGWAVADPRVIEKLWIRHDYTTLTPNMLSDRLGTMALEPARRDRILARTGAILRANLPGFEAWVAGHGHILGYVRPAAGAIAYVKYDLPMGSSALVERIRREQSVLVVPGSHFGMGKYLRVGYGGDPENLQKGLERVDRVIGELTSGAA